MDHIANEAMGYHPESRAEFFRDVMAEIKDHMENDRALATQPAKQDSDSK